MSVDALDTLAGIAPGSPLDALRRRKPITRDNAQASFDALFGTAGGLPPRERAALALFVAGLHGDGSGQALYSAMLDDDTLTAAVATEVGRGAGAGPYGSFPAGPLSAEDQPGPHYAASPAGLAALGERLAAAFAHAHMLVFHPRDATPDAVRALERAGWSATEIVTLSQLVAFLCFQLRAAHGLRALARSAA